MEYFLVFAFLHVFLFHRVFPMTQWLLIDLILKTIKLRLREVQDHTANECQSQGYKPGLPHFKSAFFNVILLLWSDRIMMCFQIWVLIFLEINLHATVCRVFLLYLCPILLNKSVAHLPYRRFQYIPIRVLHQSRLVNLYSLKILLPYCTFLPKLTFFS